MSDSDNESIERNRNKFTDERSKTTIYDRPEKLVYDQEKQSRYSRPQTSERKDIVRNRSYSPNFEQHTKRSRHNNYQNRAYRNNRYETYQQPSYDLPKRKVRPHQTSLIPFKAFILNQDDRISDTDAIANYIEYKLKFQVQQIENFFAAHRSEEWFRIKYHPEKSKKYKEEQAKRLQRRVSVFLELLNTNKIDCLTLDFDKTNELLKYLDTVELKLEGGTDEDIAALEKEYSELENKELKGESEYGDAVPCDNKLTEISGEVVNNKEVSTEEIQIAESKTTHEKPVQQENEMEKEQINKNKEVKMEKHKTSSIFFRCLSPTITREEMESICSKYDGFQRVSLSDPLVLKNNSICRGWVTFKKGSNVKEICQNINKLRIKKWELDGIVNRDLTNRIVSVNGITADKEVVKSDIRISTKIVLHLDQQSGLWLNNDEDKESNEQKLGFLSSNPVLHNLSDYLVEEEASALDKELLGLNTDENYFNRDDNLIAILDKIILYLRVVHSVDYYSQSKYPNEDEMPNRCGSLHVRGPPPTNKFKMPQVFGQEAKAKLAEFLPEEKLNDTEYNSKLINLVLKDSEIEIDKFVLDNTKELSKDKWQCSLSGKKFKGPDFVRKHILLKYCDKIEEMKMEVEFFNNYVRDPKRLALVLKESTSYASSRDNHHGFGSSYRSHSERVMDEPSSSREVIRYEDLEIDELNF